MASKFASAAEDELTCPVCFQFYTPPHEPKNLPKCAHILCRLCLQKMTDGGLKTIKCPQCNKVSTLPEDGVDSLTTSLIVRNLAEKHPTGIKQRKEQMQDEFQQAGEQVVKRLKEVKEAEKQIQHSIEQEEKEIKKSITVIQAQAHAQAQELLNQINSSSGLAEIKQHVAQLETNVKNIHASQSKVESMSEDEFCSQTDALANQLRKLQLDSKPKTNTDQCVSKFIANEHVQLGRIVKSRQQSRQLEWVQEFGDFHFASGMASNSNGLLAVCNSTCTLSDKLKLQRVVTVTLFQNENSQFKSQHEFEAEIDELNIPNTCVLGSMRIALDGNHIYLVGAKLTPGFEVYSSNGKYQKTVSLNEPKQQHEINMTLSITTTTDGKILTGSVTAEELNVVTVHDAECTLLTTILTSISPYFITDICGTHVAMNDLFGDKVGVYNLNSGKETLNLDIFMPAGICYDKQSHCMLISRYMRRDENGEPVRGTGVIDQYCITTGKLVACLAKELESPDALTFVDDNTIAVTNLHTVKLCKITNTKPAQAQQVISDAKPDSKQDSSICSNPSCATPAHLVSGGLKKCARCLIAAYCGKQCQRKDWKSHRIVCGKR